MSIDSIVHVTPDGRWFGRNLEATPDHVLRDMDRAAFEMSVVVGLAGHIENTFVSDVCKQHADRFVAALSIDPSSCATPEAAVALYHREIRDTGARALKLHPRLHGYDLSDLRFVAVLEAAATSPAPPLIWLDTLLYSRAIRLSRPPVLALQSITSQFPALTFVLLHGGGPDVLALAEAIRDCPNAHIDLSFTLTRYEHSSVWQDIRFLLGHFDRRLLFGSDFPEITLPDALAAFARVSDGVGLETRQRVMGGNLRQLLAAQAVNRHG